MKPGSTQDKSALTERGRIADLFSQSPISMAILIGPDHVFEYANKSYLALIDGRNVVGKSVAEALPEVPSQGLIALLDQVYKKGTRFEAHERSVFLKKSAGEDLTEYFLDFSYDPLRDENGNVIGIMVVAMDVTFQVRARQEVERTKVELEVEKQNFRKLFHETDEIVAVMRGPEHRFEYVNPAHVRLLGKNATGMTVREAQPEAGEVHELLDHVYQTGHTARFKEIAVDVRDDKRFFDLIYSARFNVDGKIDGVMALAVDVTTNVRAKKRLEKEKEKEASGRDLAQQQQDLLEAILNCLPCIVFLVEPGTGRAIFANREAKRFYGNDVTEKDTTKRYSKLRSIQDIHGNPLSHEQTPSGRAAVGETVRDVEVIVATDEGEFHIQAYSEHIPAIGDLGPSILVFGQDITAIRKAEQRASEARLQTEKEKQRLVEIFKQAPVGITIVRGPEFVYEMVNDNYRAMLQNSREFIGRRYIDVFPELKNQGLIEILEHIYKTGESYHGSSMPVEINVNGSLQKHYYDFIIQALYEFDGSISGLLTVVLDVTSQVEARHSVEQQQKKVQESEARFRQLADSMPQIVWTARPDGILNYTNRRWTQYSGSDDPEAWINFVHPEDLKRVEEEWMHSVRTGLAYEIEFRLHRKDGTYRWHLVRAVQIFDSIGRVSNWFGTCTDIQDQKEVQVEVSIAKAAAEMANSAKTAFLANMSHEIRTPLAAILGFTDLLNTSNLQAEEKKYLDVIIRNSHMLTRVIDDILDISKIEAGKLDIEKIAFSPTRVLNEVVDLFQEKASGKGISVQLSIDSSVPSELISDPSRLRQILINIIGNAVKFTSKGRVDVTASAQTISSDQLCLSIQVKDTGVGLDSEQAKKLFQPFTQAETASNRKFGGTGLGLVISKKLAQALGGQLQLLQCAPNQGCTFEISIQTKRVTAVQGLQKTIETAKTPQKKNRLRGLRILGVDDSVDNRALLQHFLKREAADYDEAESGEMALSKINGGDFDVILMDIQMPGIDGYEAVRILRQQGYKKPIIALTAHAMAEERRRTLESGFDDHVTKPIDANILVEAILKQNSSQR